MGKAYASIPVYLVVPVLYWLVFRGAGFPMGWAAFGIGALGWWVAYLLRLPIILLLKKPSMAEMQNRIVYFSGPLEEGIRLTALLLTGRSMHWALSLGQGWAAIEVAFAIVNVIALTSLRYRTDEKAIQAKEMLKTTGIRLDGSPLWGAVERVFASGFHIGITLLVAWNPWMVIVMVPVHSAFNSTSMYLIKKSVVLMECMVAVAGMTALTAGLLVYSV